MKKRERKKKSSNGESGILGNDVIRMRLDQLSPAEYNPRSISPEAKAGLSASLERFGMVEAFVWNTKTKTLVGGHKRLEALQDQGHDGGTLVNVIPVNLDDAEERVLNITLNNPHVQGVFNAAELQEMIPQVLEAFTPVELEAVCIPEMLKSVIPNRNDSDFSPIPPAKRLDLKAKCDCPKCGYTFIPSAPIQKVKRRRRFGK